MRIQSQAEQFPGLDKVRQDLSRPGAVSFLEKNEYGNWQGRCGAKDCDWMCHGPDPSDPRLRTQHVHSSESAATNCLNKHLKTEHGLS